MFGSCSYLLFDWRMSLFGSLILLYFLNELFGWLWRSWTPKSNGIQGGKQWIECLLKILLIDRHDANMKDMKRNNWNRDSPKTHYQNCNKKLKKEVEHAKRQKFIDSDCVPQKLPSIIRIILLRIQKSQGASHLLPNVDFFGSEITLKTSDYRLRDHQKPRKNSNIRRGRQKKRCGFFPRKDNPPPGSREFELQSWEPLPWRSQHRWRPFQPRSLRSIRHDERFRGVRWGQGGLEWMQFKVGMRIANKKHLLYLFVGRLLARLRIHPIFGEDFITSL